MAGLNSYIKYLKLIFQSKAYLLDCIECRLFSYVKWIPSTKYSFGIVMNSTSRTNFFLNKVRNKPRDSGACPDILNWFHF